MKQSAWKSILLAALLAPLTLAGPRDASNGVSDERILFGQSCALTGHAAELGEDMQAGLRAAFATRNELGGIHGRRLDLETLDDRFSSERSGAATRALIEEHHVFALIGQVGTHTSRSAARVCESSGVPFIAPLSGAAFLRRPDLARIVNLRADFDQEMERLVQYLVDSQGYTNIACFYENDGHGKAGLAGVERALKQRGLQLSSVGFVRRNTTAVTRALASIGSTAPDAVVMVASHRAAAAFVRSAKRTTEMQDTVFCMDSTTDITRLASTLGREAEGCIASQVVPNPWDTSLPVVAAYQRAMRASGAEARIGFLSLEAYLAGELVCQVLESLEDEPTRADFLTTLDEIRTFDLGGLDLHFGPGDRQGMDAVFLSTIESGAIVPLH